MSFSTCSFCYRSTSNSSETLKTCPMLRDAWASELDGRLHLYNEPVDKFIETLLPCSTPYALQAPSQDTFKTYKPGPGREVSEYKEIVAGCTSLVDPFPSAKKLEFADTHTVSLDFPFRAFADHHHPTAPDISVSFPGQPLHPEDKSWQNIAMVIESKDIHATDPFPATNPFPTTDPCAPPDPLATTDPFLRKGKKHSETVEQLAKNARNLMLAHGLLAAFVVGIYGTRVRLVRFDHSCALVSRSFGIKSKEGVRLLQKFFWHFSHPLAGGTVAGSDPTVMKADPDTQEWVKQELQKARVTHWQKHVERAHEGRRVEVYDEQTGRCVPYLLYQLLDVNGRLFSRATMVWRAIEDTRIWQDGRLVPDPSRTGPVKPRILKEAWRQLVRTAEAKFYQRLNARIPKEDWYGLATMVCGGDLGEFELRWWKETIRRREEGRPHAATDSTSPPGPSNPAPSSRLFSSTGSTASPAASSVASPQRYIPHEDFPLPYPQHQTYSWQLIMGKDEFHRDRSHMRMVIDDVGRPLTRFKNTHELVRAVRDAIKGHQIAWEKAQVMHRDISVGNILINEKGEEGKFLGFLHDYDYSAMDPDPPEAEGTDESSSAMESSTKRFDGDPTHTAAELGDAAKHKEPTGTYYFMAYEILIDHDTIHDTHHDLESFYWVLMWVIARHTDHQHKYGIHLCSKIFKYGDDYASAGAKGFWLQQARFNIPKNQPLTHLLNKLTRTVLKQIPMPNRDNVSMIPLQYEVVLQVFDEAIAMPGWPVNDWIQGSVFKGEERGDGPGLDGPVEPPEGLVTAPALLGAADGSADPPKKRSCETIPEDDKLDVNGIPRSDETTRKKRAKRDAELGPTLTRQQHHGQPATSDGISPTTIGDKGIPMLTTIGRSDKSECPSCKREKVHSGQTPLLDGATGYGYIRSAGRVRGRARGEPTPVGPSSDHGYALQPPIETVSSQDS